MDALSFLYQTVPGRLLLKPLTSQRVSSLSGAFMDSRLSRFLIRPFVQQNEIDPTEYETDHIGCFNDFFARRIRPGLRPVDPDPGCLIAPCDGLLSVYPIHKGLVIPVKQSRYSIADLVQDARIAREFHAGFCLVFRLCVHHYHRYCYPVSGRKGPQHYIPGVFHTVRPVALREEPVFCRNTREYTVLHTESAGAILQMEVGAMLVGRIVNEKPEPGPVCRGMEKGYFSYGGSTVILLTQSGRFTPSPSLSDSSETSVVQGQRIGTLQNT